jgi:hypothetical protein
VKKITLLIILLCAVSILFNCGGGGENSTGSSEVTVSATFIKNQSSLLYTSSTLNRIRYTVSGPGMKTLIGSVPVQGDLVEFVLNVPNGPHRHFVIEALDAEDHVRYSGDAYQDLDGKKVTIVIELVERTLDVSGDWLFYRTISGETQEQGPFCSRITQIGDALSVIGYETEIGEISGSGTLRGDNIELILSFMACDNEGTITITATTDGNTMSGTFTLTGGCLDVPITGSWRAERGECSLPKAEVSVRIAYFEDTYALDFFADEVSDVQITSATATGPHVETLTLDYTCSVGYCRWFALASFGQTMPTPGDTYTFSLQYSDGTSEVLTDSVYELGVGPPVPLSPQHGETVETTNPTFSWQPPAWGCASWYHLIVRDMYGNDIWWPAIPGDTTSAVYNFDGQATQTLTPGESYSWVVNAFDDCEHQHMGHNNFSGADGGIFTVSTGGGGTTTYNMVDYFPLGLGDSWTYEEEFGGFYTRTVTGTETVNGTEAYKMEEIGDLYTLFTNDSNGLRRHKTYTIDNGSWRMDIFDPPLFYSAAVFSVGDSHPYNSTVSYSDGEGLFDTGTISGTSSVEGIEDVVVPAGAFEDCLRVKITENYALSGGSLSFTTDFTIWLAKGVGIVKDIGSETISVFGVPLGTFSWDEKLASATVGGISHPSLRPF